MRFFFHLHLNFPVSRLLSVCYSCIFFLYQLIALFTICAEKYKNIKVRAVIARKCNNTQEAASVALPAGAGGAAPRRKQFFSQLSKNWWSRKKGTHTVYIVSECVPGRKSCSTGAGQFSTIWEKDTDHQDTEKNWGAGLENARLDLGPPNKFFYSSRCRSCCLGLEKAKCLYTLWGIYPHKSSRIRKCWVSKGARFFAFITRPRLRVVCRKSKKWLFLTFGVSTFSYTFWSVERRC